jgi:3'-phosphoadenosine 5'-phosphosulfate sulfotransferase (PAPS reductase)/FAD synthetase
MTPLVVPANFSDESIALIQYLSQTVSQPVYVVFIHTGWAAEPWTERIALAKIFVQNKGFHWIELTSPLTFPRLVQDRNSFPSPKFQWCAALLKGIPLLNWLDDIDLTNEWTICLAKRQALMKAPLPEYENSSEHYGERRLWHPLWQHTQAEIDVLLTQASLPRHPRRSLECDPCVHASSQDLLCLKPKDIEKTAALEAILQRPFFPHLGKNITAATEWAHLQPPKPHSHQPFGRGCADPFGCGL